ncbi:radical SAM protein [Candidatus Woesearchaeota archaeon]|nr:radical SAM protein [Candidatus Woesearchaeota archaeon]
MEEADKLKMVRKYYFAITNACNRSCELCSCYSDPTRSTYLNLETFKEILPKEGDFEVQLEGGEPTLHPNLEDMIRHAQETGRCTKVTLGTNATLLPYAYIDKKLDFELSVKNIKDYFLKFKTPFTLKPSINYYLIKSDCIHLDKAESIRDAFSQLKTYGDYSLVFNVRRRKKPLSDDDDEWLVKELDRRGLKEISNLFFYQRYGYAKDREELELPFIIPDPVEFYLIGPDGKNWGTDLIARSEGMKDMG